MIDKDTLIKFIQKYYEILKEQEDIELDEELALNEYDWKKTVYHIGQLARRGSKYKNTCYDGIQKKGRPKIDEDKVNQVLQLLNAGMTIRETSKLAEISVPSVQKIKNIYIKHIEQ